MSFRKLSPNLKSHPIIVYSGGLKALFALLERPHLNTQKQAASALRDICANPDYKLKCAEEGGIDATIMLMRQPEQALQALGMAALRHLSTNDALKRTILDRRALRPALKCAQHKNEDLHLQCAGLIANESELQINQVRMVEDGCVVGLVDLAYSHNDEVQQ